MSKETTSPQLSTETLVEDVQKAEASYVTALDSLASHYLSTSQYALATPLYRKLISIQTLNGEKGSTRDLYNLAISLNRQKKVKCYQEAKLILEDVVPRLLFRQRLDEDPEQFFLQQEVGAYRELLVGMEGVGMAEGDRVQKEEVEYVAKRAVDAVKGLESTRGTYVRGLVEASGTFRGLWEV
jgi:hypothetical protein